MSNLLSQSTIFANSQAAFYHALIETRYGNYVTARGFETKELRNVTLTVTNPTQRCLIMPHRNDNIFAKIAETLWVLAGRNDITWLKFFLPRAPEYSDDGKTWRAGYGPRLRGWWSINYNVDQVDECRKLLIADPSTRRAVMSLWDPALDYCESKDIPCNGYFHWLIRDNHLHLNITQRSSDVMFGFSGINLFEWGVLQQLMAHWTNYYVGELTYFISSLHLYAKHYARAEKIIEAYPGKTLYNISNQFRSPEMTVPFEQFDDMLHEIFKTVDSVIDGTSSAYTPSIKDPFFDLCMRMICLYAFDKVHKDHPKRIDALCEMLSALPISDFRLAAIEYYFRDVRYVLDVATHTEFDALKELGMA